MRNLLSSAKICVKFDHSTMLTLAHLQAISTFCYAAIFENTGADIDKYAEYDYLIALANADTDVFTTWEALAESKAKWRMGILPYQLKQHFEPKLSSEKKAEIPFPEVAFFVPQCLLIGKKGATSPQILGDTSLWESVLAAEEKPITPTQSSEFVANYTEAEYIATIEQLQQHIKEGDTYEINLAQRFLAKSIHFSPANVYHQLRQVSQVPFAAFVKWKELYLLCASPERFLKLQENTLISQPIKGTAPRGKNAQEDMRYKAHLQNSLKEQAENVMIVDLTRNDLYRSSEINSVKVPYLFEIQSFPTVHQLVSTVIGKKREEVSWAETIANTFPPGSMTGAPKVRTAQLIAEYESVERGIYAGSAGYISPENAFDFNVIIRSLVYDASQNLLSYHVGGAITADSVPKEEYAETLLKAEAIRKILL